MKTNVRSYREAEVMSSTPEQLVLLFYRELRKSLQTGADHIESRRLEEKAEELSRARGLLIELLGALNMEHGGELSARLASLYSYFLHEIDEASRTLDARRLDPVIAMVAELEDAWSQAASQLSGNGAPSSGRSSKLLAGVSDTL